MTKTSQKVYGVQVLRAVAASLVMFSHISDIMGARQERAFDGWIGGVGVDIFFVISGFIMARLVDGRPAGLPEAVRFLSNRIARIIPIYWLMTGLVILFWAVTGAAIHTTLAADHSVTRILRSLAFLPGPIIGAGWTLTYEMVFYGLMGAALLVAPRWRLASVVAILVLVASSRIAFGWLFGLATLENQSLPLVLEFAIGIWLHRLTSARQPSGWIAFPLFFVGAAILFLTSGNHAVTHGHPLWMLASLLLVLSFVWTERWIKWPRLFVQIGDASYCLYLINLYVIMVVDLFLAHVLDTTTDMGILLFVVMSCVLAWLLSLLMHAWIERPMTRWMQVGLMKLQSKIMSPRPAVA